LNLNNPRSSAAICVTIPYSGGRINVYRSYVKKYSCVRQLMNRGPLQPLLGTRLPPSCN
jgi:hypothetical protein